MAIPPRALAPAPAALATPAAGEGARRARQRAAALLLLAGLAALALGPPLLAPPARAEDPLLYALGRRAALLALGLLALQLVLAARLRFVDLAIGLGGAMRLHRAAGVIALGLVVLHPGLLLWATGGALRPEWRVALGAAALLVLALGVLAALLFRRLGVDYLRWRALHRAMLAAIALGAVHGRVIGEDLRAPGGLRLWWSAVLLGAAALVAWRALRPRWRRRGFRVVSVAAEARGIWTLTLAPEDGRRLDHLPGQFVFLTLLRAGLPAEEHPFSLSSPPSPAGLVAVTVKEVGDFTRTIGRTRPGDLARVEGPFGRFSHALHPAARLVLVGAGVGSTPLVAMLRALRDAGDSRPVLFLCVNRAEADIPFRDELGRLPAPVRVVHVLSQPEASWRGARGRLDAQLLRRLAGEALPGAEVFLCGPPPFMADVGLALRRLGVPRRRIHTERFAVP